MDKSTSTLGRVASVLGVASKHSKGSTPIETILKMQHFQIWGFILMILAVACIIWLIQKKLDSIDKQYKEQFIILHRLFKSHQDLQIKVHKFNNNNNNNNVAPVVNNVVPNVSKEPNVFIPQMQKDDIDLNNVPNVEEVAHVESVNESVNQEDVHIESVDESIDESVNESVDESNESVNDQKVVEIDDSLPEMFD